MPTIYTEANAEVSDRIARMMAQFHGELHTAGVTIEALFATSEEGAAVKHHGYACLAKVKINSYELRVQSHHDAKITIDRTGWDNLNPSERDALIDHELEHLKVQTDEHKVVQTDDLGRPKLRIQLHDQQFGWFDCIARRHGPASQEVQQYEAFARTKKQLWLFDQTAGESKPLKLEEAVA